MRRPASRLTLASVCLLAVASGFGAAAEAQESQPRPPVIVDFTVGTPPLERNATALAAGATALSHASDLALDSIFSERYRGRRTSGAVLRLMKLALLDVPVIHFTAGLNHEFGHLAKAGEAGTTLAFRLRGGPWSSGMFDLRAAPDTQLDLATCAGGFEAEFLLERRIWERAGEEDAASVADAVFLLNGAAGRFYYVHDALSKVGGSIYDDVVANAGDPTRYLYGWLAQRSYTATPADVRATARSMRARAWLNFADVGLWAQAWNVLKHVGTGQDSFRPYVIGIRGVGLAPFTRYHLSPAGPQTEIGTRYRTRTMSGEMSLRWTDAVDRSRLFGGSFSLSVLSIRSLRPKVRFDLWRDISGQLGARMELGVAAARWPSPRAALQLAAGAKREGYVLGLAQKRGPYVQTGLRVRF